MILARSWACAALLCVLGLGVTAPVASLPPTYRVLQLRLVDHARKIRLPDGRRVPRSIDTTVRVPITGGPYPLIVFGHGFALTPRTYNRLLRAWARAGYVVAAPWFPLERADATGGPDEADLANEPRDVSFVISRLLGLSEGPGGPLRDKIDASRIAVAGHSDGGITALAAAFDRRFRDRRIRAAIVMSGAALRGMGPFPRGGPPLLAMQGTADPINSPATTAGYFRIARRPKFRCGCSGRHICRRTQRRTRSSGSWNARAQRSSITTSRAGRFVPSSRRRRVIQG
jgi:pimeloyl-ACP methyl ester carboxylesterase